MKAQHTPGPWNTRPGSFGGKTREVFRKDKSIKKPFFPTEIAVVCIEDAVGRANARLIAAAPDLLQALRSIAAITTCADQGSDAMCAEIQGICREALAKATAECEANARPIAATPDLLEAAIELKDVCNRPSAARTRAEAWRKLDKAIAKATRGAA